MSAAVARFACVYCSAPATEWDHLTGRDDAGAYLDPGLVVPACRRCNLAGVECWRALGVDRIGDADTLSVRLRRLAVSFARMGSAGETVELSPLVCRALAGTLAALARTVGEEHAA